MGDKCSSNRIFVCELPHLDELLARAEDHPAFVRHGGRNPLGPVRTLVRNPRRKLDEVESEAILRTLAKD